MLALYIEVGGSLGDQSSEIKQYVEFVLSASISECEHEINSSSKDANRSFYEGALGELRNAYVICGMLDAERRVHELQEKSGARRLDRNLHGKVSAAEYLLDCLKLFCRNNYCVEGVDSPLGFKEWLEKRGQLLS